MTNKHEKMLSYINIGQMQSKIMKYYCIFTRLAKTKLSSLAIPAIGGDSYIDTNILEDNLAVPCKSEYVPTLRNSYWTSKNIPKGNSCSYTWGMYKTIFNSSIIHNNKKLEILMFSNRLVKLIVAYSLEVTKQRKLVNHS